MHLMWKRRSVRAYAKRVARQKFLYMQIRTELWPEIALSSAGRVRLRAFACVQVVY